MVVLPLAPICSHTPPVTVDITLVYTEAVAVETDAFVATPDPTGTTMQTVTVVVALDQVPVASNLDPFCTSPTSQSAQAVQMVANSTVATPEPA